MSSAQGTKPTEDGNNNVNPSSASGGGGGRRKVIQVDPSLYDGFSPSELEIMSEGRLAAGVNEKDLPPHLQMNNIVEYRKNSNLKNRMLQLFLPSASEPPFG